MAMAWSQDDSFFIESLNTTKGPGKSISKVSLLGYNGDVKFVVNATGLRILAMAKPAGLDHVFAFQIRTQGSKMGFITLDSVKQGQIRPGSRATLTWWSGGPPDSSVSIEIWTSAEGWRQIASEVPNTGSFDWSVPMDLIQVTGGGELITRIRSVEEHGIAHTTSFPVDV